MGTTPSNCRKNQGGILLWGILWDPPSATLVGAATTSDRRSVPGVPTSHRLLWRPCQPRPDEPVHHSASVGNRAYPDLLSQALRIFPKKEGPESVSTQVPKCIYGRNRRPLLYAFLSRRDLLRRRLNSPWPINARVEPACIGDVSMKIAGNSLLKYLRVSFFPQFACHAYRE